MQPRGIECVGREAANGVGAYMGRCGGMEGVRWKDMKSRRKRWGCREVADVSGLVRRVTVSCE
jgi:hypothetical protein